MAACALYMDSLTLSLSLIFLLVFTHTQTTTIKNDTVDGRPHLHAYPLLHIPYIYHWHLKTMRYRTLIHIHARTAHPHTDSCKHPARNGGKKHKRLNIQRFCIDNYSNTYKTAHIYKYTPCYSRRVCMHWMLCSSPSHRHGIYTHAATRT